MLINVVRYWSNDIIYDEHATKECWSFDAPQSAHVSPLMQIEVPQWIKENGLTSKWKLINVDQCPQCLWCSSMLIHWATYFNPPTKVIVYFQVNRFSLIHWVTSICIDGSTWVDQSAPIDQKSYMPVICIIGSRQNNIDQDWTSLINTSNVWSTSINLWLTSINFD